jgi:hypothetical protein
VNRRISVETRRETIQGVVRRWKMNYSSNNNSVVLKRLKALDLNTCGVEDVHRAIFPDWPEDRLKKGGWVNLTCDLCNTDVERGVRIEIGDEEVQGTLVCKKCIRGMAKLLKASGGPTP